MTKKLSESIVSTPNRLGDNLNYNLDYDYIQGTRKASRIGNRHYSYDLNGNLIAERDGSNAVNPEIYRPYYQDGDLYWTDYGFGVTRPQTQNSSDGVYQRNYRWNERNLLSESSDSAFTVQYRYGADGQRAIKYVLNNRRSTLYFNRMWQTNDSRAEWVQSKHIYLGEQRILTKYNSEGNNNTQAERERIYYYHSDHLGSAQTITNHIGQLHERIEYTPYGELWIDWKNLNSPSDGTPFRFTGKELDAETGLYYYGARYLDPRISRWLSVDPAMYEGDYLPSAPVSDEARQRNQNLPGMGGIYNYVNFHVYHYGGNNPVMYTDPDGRYFISGYILSLIGNLTGARNDGIWEGAKHNYRNQWQIMINPSMLLTPLGWTSFQDTLGYFAGTIAIGIFGGDVHWNGFFRYIDLSNKAPWGLSLGSIGIGIESQRDHEKGHYYQSLLLGPLYIPVIGIPSLISATFNLANHDNVYTEIWANWFKNKFVNDEQWNIIMNEQNTTQINQNLNQSNLNDNTSSTSRRNIRNMVE
ncbi:MAG: hypothetical protein FWD47_14355 [Treponema sp.]|nr:hypothetical protein [Treponema sp.]